MASKKKVVRRKTGLTSKGRRKSNGKRVARKSSPVSRKKKLVRTRIAGGKRAPKKRSKPARKVATRKHAPRKRSTSRKHTKRPELLLKRKKKRTPPASKRAKKTSNKQRQRKRITRAFDESEDGGSSTSGYTIGPIGNSFDEDFAEIDWSGVDWDDIADDFGDEEEDSYGEDAK